MLKLKIIIGIVVMGIVSFPAKASMFGEENAALYAILAQAIQQVTSLKKIIDLTEETKGALDSIRRSADETLGGFKNNPIEAGIYDDWTSYDLARGRVAEVFGAVPQSPEERIQRDADQDIAETITNNNRLYESAKALDDVAADIRRESLTGSPGTAQKITAHALGVVIQALNQNMRAQASSNKLQAQMMAIQNRRDKERAKHDISSASAIETEFTTKKANFELPSF